MSDELALGVMRAAARHRLSIPATLAVTGWDDSAAADLAGLTTFSQSLEERGSRCARIVLGEGPEDADAEWRMVRRDSTRRQGSKVRAVREDADS